MSINYACNSREHRIARRQFLGTVAAAGAGAITGGLGVFSNPAVAAQLQSDQKRIVVFELHGGLSQLESWDPKPGTETGGPFRSISTSVPGIHVSELLPKTAKQMHHLCLVRGVNTSEDATIHDGLWDCYGNKHMGAYGDQCALKCSFSRTEQDDFAVRSYTRARKAVADRVFKGEIIPGSVTIKKSVSPVTHDEEPARFDEAKLRALRPAFGQEGTITAGNASSVNDGAAALVVAAKSVCESARLKPVARIVGSATFSREPEWFTLAPVGALRKQMDAVNWSVADVDLFEVNEAFAAVAMAAERELNIPSEKLNVCGGAVALGHPIGCSGARILVTLLNALQRTSGRRGIVCLCIGGGEAVAMAIERTE